MLREVLMLKIFMLRHWVFRYLSRLRNDLAGFQSNIKKIREKSHAQFFQIFAGKTSNFVSTDAIKPRKQIVNECQGGKQIRTTGIFCMQTVEKTQSLSLTGSEKLAFGTTETFPY